MQELLTEQLLIISVVVIGVVIVAISAVIKGRAFWFRFKKGSNQVDMGVRKQQEPSSKSPGSIRNVKLGENAKIVGSEVTYNVGHVTEAPKLTGGPGGDIENVEGGTRTEVKDSSVTYNVGHTAKEKK